MSRDECWVPVWLGLGSNQDSPRDQLERAFRKLNDLPRTQLLRRSALYRNPPMGSVPQADFLNAVAGLLTQLEPDVLLEHLQALEEQAGRQRESELHWGPRPLDLDLLIYGQAILSLPGLTVPHPGIAERNFVLFPLLATAPELHIPGLGSVRRLAEQADATGLEKVD